MINRTKIWTLPCGAKSVKEPYPSDQGLPRSRGGPAYFLRSSLYPSRVHTSKKEDRPKAVSL